MLGSTADGSANPVDAAPIYEVTVREAVVFKLPAIPPPVCPVVEVLPANTLRVDAAVIITHMAIPNSLLTPVFFDDPYYTALFFSCQIFNLIFCPTKINNYKIIPIHNIKHS